MNEDAIKAEVRLYAVEWLACQATAILAKASGGDAVLAGMRDQALAGARAKTFADLDPAMSDLLSAELESAVDRLLTMTKELLGKPQSSEKPRG